MPKEIDTIHTETIEEKDGLLSQCKSFVMAGPCSAETEEQVLDIAQQLASLESVNLFRAGIWKPRTRPGSFEGIGEIGLDWLQKVKSQTGLPVSVEIANAKQVDLALKYGIDVLWLGARTTVNPFTVQEIADAVKGVDIPIIIKNPVNPDLELWVGAVERVMRAGIREIGLIHRGFSSYTKTMYRNPPYWQLAIEMKRLFPHLLFIIDPSHICGDTNGLKEIAQYALDLDYDGIMLEVHNNPSQAWSDAKQQVTPQQFKAILDGLIWRKSNFENIAHLEELEKLRSIIDQMDDEIVDLLGHRMNISERIGQLKNANNITILQTDRWNHILAKVIKKGEHSGLSKDFIRKYFNAIHMESIKRQKNFLR